MIIGHTGSHTARSSVCTAMSGHVVFRGEGCACT